MHHALNLQQRIASGCQLRTRTTRQAMRETLRGHPSLSAEAWGQIVRRYLVQVPIPAGTDSIVPSICTFEGEIFDNGAMSYIFRI